MTSECLSIFFVDFFDFFFDVEIITNNKTIWKVGINMNTFTFYIIKKNWNIKVRIYFIPIFSTPIFLILPTSIFDRV